ncbi:MAG: hypothetical protein COA79_13460 [Planctomycetota bacterium]|nr:MAG: hypothetical protein COA79_13460 [Planctomycetota bacterium]
MKFILISFMFIIFSTSCFAEEKDKQKEQILKLIKELGHDDFKVREEATNTLLIHTLTIKNISNQKIKTVGEIAIQKRIKILNQNLKIITDVEIQERIKLIVFTLEKKYKDLTRTLIKESKHEVTVGNYEKALAFSIRALKLSPNSQDANMQYCEVLSKLGDYEKAVSIYEKYLKTVEIDNFNREFYIIRLTNICIEGNLLNKAKIYLEKALPTSRYPDNILNKLSIVYEHTKQYDKAEKNINNLIKTNSKTTRYHSTLAWFYVRSNQPKKAKLILEKFFDLKVNKNDFTITDILNRYYFKQPKVALKEVSTLIKGTIVRLTENEDIRSTNINSNHVLFSCIWFYLNHFHNEGKKSEATTENFKKWYKKINDTDKKIWPLPLLGYFGGVLTDQQLFDSAKTKSNYKTRQQLCEAYYYAGLRSLTKNDKKMAHKFFKKSIAQNVFDYIELTGSHFELNKKK